MSPFQSLTRFKVSDYLGGLSAPHTQKLVAIFFSVLLLNAPGFNVAAVSAQVAGPDIREHGTLGDDFYAAGGRVDLKGNIDGDAIIAGGQLKIGEEIRGDATLAGGIVTLNGKVFDDVRVAGGDVDIDALISGDLVAIGGNVILQETSRVDGHAWIAAGDVTIFGEIGQNLEVAGGTVRLGGKIGGNAQIAAGRLEILPSAQISGQLSYTSANEVVISPDAVIGGPITRNLSEDHFGHEFHAKDAGVGASLVWTIGLTLTGMILFLALPRLMTRVIEQFQVTPWKSLGLGFVVLVVTPMLAILSIVLIVGAPLGLLLVAIYPITLLIAYVTAATWLGDTVLGLIGRKNPETWPWRSGALLAALLALSVVGLVPFIGGLILFLAVVGGLGAWAVVIADRLRTA